MWKRDVGKIKEHDMILLPDAFSSIVFPNPAASAAAPLRVRRSRFHGGPRPIKVRIMEESVRRTETYGLRSQPVLEGEKMDGKVSGNRAPRVSSSLIRRAGTLLFRILPGANPLQHPSLW